MKRCERCGSTDDVMLHCISLYPCEGLDEGDHIADVELRLCGPCSEFVADDLLSVREKHCGKAVTR